VYAFKSFGTCIVGNAGVTDSLANHGRRSNSVLHHPHIRLHRHREGSLSNSESSSRSAKVHLKASSNWDVKSMLDVIATLHGSNDDQWVVRGDNYDA